MKLPVSVSAATLLLISGGVGHAQLAAAPQPGPGARPADPQGGPPPASGPSGSSQLAPGEQRYDEVGQAGTRGVSGSGGAAGTAVIAVHRSLPADTIVEVTNLDTGKTVLVLVTAQMPVPNGRIMDISPAAARLLGFTGDSAPVRVRKVVASPQDIAALRSGQAAAARMDSPQSLLIGLRSRMGGVASGTVVTAAVPPSVAPPVTPVAVPVAPPVAVTRPPVAVPPPARPRVREPEQVPEHKGRFYVQVAALSSADRAKALASSLGGRTQERGNLHLVQLGPFATATAAQQARAGVAQKGYADARVVTP